MFGSIQPRLMKPIREGFVYLSQLSDGQLSEAFKWAALRLHVHLGPYEVKSPDVLVSTGLEESTVAQAFWALSVLVSAAAHRPEYKVEDFVQAGIAIGLFGETEVETVRALLSLVQENREAVLRHHERAHLTRVGQATLFDFKFAVDLRTGHGRDGRIVSVPLAVISIETRDDVPEFRVQMTAAQVENLIRDLQDVHKRLRDLEGDVITLRNSNVSLP